MKQQRDEYGRFLRKEDQPSPAQAKALRNQRYSFAVSYIRAKDLVAGGAINANKNNPSKRRFATVEEANQHGSRFTVIEEHLGFYVTRTNDRPTDWVNGKTGKTNPVIVRD